MSPLAFDVPRLLSFLLFLILGARIPFTRTLPTRRRAINEFIGYVLAVSLLAGASQFDNWPFASYTLAAFRARIDAPFCQTEFYGVDRHGRETFVDPMAWSPVYSSILQYWFELNFRRLSSADQQEVLRFLLAKAESWRQRSAAGKRSGFERYLGAASAPYWWLLPRAKTAGPDPFLRLRIYYWCVIPDDRYHARNDGVRRLVAEGPQ